MAEPKALIVRQNVDWPLTVLFPRVIQYPGVFITQIFQTIRLLIRGPTSSDNNRCETPS